MPHRWTNLLQEHGVVTLDGGLATELERDGAQLDNPLWSGIILRSQPELIRQCHQSYFEAGAQVATTASYQLTHEGMRATALKTEEFDRLIELSIRLAREASRGEGLVAGSVGPYGAMLNDGSEYTGDYEVGVEALSEFHRPRIKALVEGGVDVIALETFPSLREAQAAVEVVFEAGSVPCWVSFTCRDAGTTAAGESLRQCAEVLSQYPQVSAIGVNCVSPEVAIDAVALLHESTDLPIIAYPNSGERYDAGDGTWDDHPSDMTATQISRKLVQAGAHIIGGCCRTDPSWISAAREEYSRKLS